MRTVLQFWKCFSSTKKNPVVLCVLCTFFLYFINSIVKKPKDKHVDHEPHNILYRYRVYSQPSEGSVSREPLNWVPIILLTEPNVCEQKNDKIKYLFVVHSNAENFGEREFLRKQIFNSKNSKTYHFTNIFVIGTSKSSNSTQISKEAHTHRDLLVLDINENYHNITHKARGWIKWVYENCAQSEYTHVVKIDDDVMVNLKGLMELLDEFKNGRKMVLCRIFPNGIVVRNNQSKWYLSKKEYAPNTLGVYCQGMAYITTRDLLPLMYVNLKQVQYLWMDDWYVTHGLLYNSQSVYLDLNPHVYAIENSDQLKDVLNSSKPHHNTYSPVFGHFRPKTNYDIKKRVESWNQIMKSVRVGVV